MKNKVALIFIVLFLTFGAAQAAEGNSRSVPKLMIFFSDSCHRCQEAKNKTLPDLEEEFLGRVFFEYLNLGDRDNYKLLLGLKEKSAYRGQLDIPVFYIDGNFITYSDKLKEKLRGAVLDSLAAGRKQAASAPADLTAVFKSFTPLAVIAAGLEDGINPCAFTVIVFFISFLAFQGYRKRELFLIGLAFILAVFFTYLLIGFGIFGFLYRMRGFWMVSRFINLAVGGLSIALGGLSLYDYFKFKKTADSAGLFLQLPKQLKDRIHALIGFFYRKGRQQTEGFSAPGMLKLILSAFISGFLVCLLEAVCTGQVYLPTITFVFKSTSLKIQALFYILLYNIMFIVPLLAVLLLALSGFTSGDFAKFLKKHLGLIKILMALLFLVLGILLLWRNK